MTNKVLIFCILLLGLLTVSGCSSKPFAIIDGTQSEVSDMDNFDITIVSIDGKMEFGKQIKNIKPGFHYINLLTTKKIRSKVSKPQMFPVEAKECMRYVVTAQHSNSLADQWEIKLLREVPILSCVPTENAQTIEKIPVYLSSVQESVCLHRNLLTHDISPVDLYPSIKQCIMSGQETHAIFNYFLASAYGIYDTRRVGDATAHDAINVIQKHSIWTLTPLEQDQFEQKLTAFINTPESMREACDYILSVGKPNYFPTYMIEHGVKKLSKETPRGLAINFAEDPTWLSILSSQLKCQS